VSNANQPPPHEPEPVEVQLAEDLPRRRLALGPVGHWVLRAVPFVLLPAAGWVLWREFHKLSLESVLGAMAGWGVAAILAAVALAAASFLLMGVIEWVGLRWSGARVPWTSALAGSFLANAIAHAIGANLLVAGAIRARLYDRYGVSLTQVAATTLFGGVSFAVGLGALSGIGLLAAPPADIAATAMPLHVARGLGAVLLTGALGYVVLCAVRRRPLRAFGRSLRLPTVRDAIAQVVIGVVDNGIAAAIIWNLLPAHTLGYFTFVGAYAVACVAGLLSNIPGGAGVFESAVATLLPSVAAPQLAAAFLGYRLAYYILPLVIAAIALAADTLRRGRAP
jgi:uncharacterized membrane protein YbhN (UPF0104 family)